MSRFKQITITITIPLMLVLAWTAGEIREQEAMTLRLSNISSQIGNVSQTGSETYQGQVLNNPDQSLYISVDSQPSYGGPLKTAVVVDQAKEIRFVAILDSADTHSYLEKVVDLGLLDHFIGKSIENIPEVDGISGATLSSNAVIQGVANASAMVGAVQFGMPVVEIQPRTTTSEPVKIILICLFFLAAIVIAGKKNKHKKISRNVLLSISVVTLGFWLGAQFSMSTVVSLLSGAWYKGMATYAALLCLVLAVGVFLITKKNLFCTYICPFGAVQEGLSTITGCSPPKRQIWMEWLTRAWVLALLMAALYFQAPSDAMYEPFSKAFNFIGSGIVYGLTILIVVASLIVKRPWCNLFCPAKPMFYYLRIARNAFVPNSKRRAKAPALKERSYIDA